MPLRESFLARGLFVLGLADLSSARPSWGYAPSDGCDKGKNTMCGPNEWHTIPGFESCAQKGTQSPIDMQTVDSVAMDDQGFQFEVNGKCDSNVTYLLNPHTVEVEFTSACKDTYHVRFRGKKYTLAQFHFHSPSENKWDGGHFAMEGHYVHKSEDGKEFVVLAVMIGVGSDSTKFLEAVLGDIPRPNSGASSYEEQEPLDVTNPYSFLPKSLAKIQYFFNGSMTTPTPTCNPGPTHWIMATEPVHVSQRTIDKYRALINSDPGNQLSPYGTIMGEGAKTPPVFNKLNGEISWNISEGCNNRPVQPMVGHDNPTRKLYKIGGQSKASTSAAPETTNKTTSAQPTTTKAPGAACSAHPGCAGLAGNCCPSPGGANLYCCNQGAATLLEQASEVGSPLAVVFAFALLSSVALSVAIRRQMQKCSASAVEGYQTMADA